MKQKNTLRTRMRSGLAGLLIPLVVLSSSAAGEVNKPAEIKISGDVTYFVAGKSESGAQTSYAQIDHSTTFSYNFSVSGFLDFYEDNNGYFGKTIVEKGLTDRLNLRSHITHVNDPFSQAGFGLSYALPSPKGISAKIGYLPFFVDDDGRHVDDKQIACFGGSVDLPHNFALSAFGEVNLAAEKGPEWCYGEIELARKIGKHLSIGANLQLNNKREGELAPEVIPRLSLRYLF